MNRVILIKYGELTTKKGNRSFFIKTLKRNIENKLQEYKTEIICDNSRMYIYFLEKDIEDIKKIINKIFGIHMYHIAYICDTNKDSIFKTCINAIKNKEITTFKVETKRSYKQFEEDSLTFSKNLGSYLLKQIDTLKVDVHNPELLIKVEIRKDKSYIYLDNYNGIGGYPIGTQPKALLMLSGGIDSPVAGYLAMKRGVKIDCVYFEALPHTSLDARNKVISLVKKLTNYTSSINLHIINFTKIQEEIYKKCDKTYVITIMRRMMYRIMEELCKKNKAYAIINGESIGQVASQTLVSMNIINNVTNYPVIRPVSCLDKLEIIKIAKQIDTYETSILPYEDCCTVFVPKHPIINPSLEEVLKMEENLNYENMIKETLTNTYTIKIKDKETNEFKNLL